MSECALAGRCVMVVEDEYFLADELSSTLQAAGASVLGPVATVEAALDLLGSTIVPNAAVLDMNLRGEMAYAVADALLARGVPFLFTTGYDHAVLPKRYAGLRRLEKPFGSSVLLQEVGYLLHAGLGSK